MAKVPIKVKKKIRRVVKKKTDDAAAEAAEVEVIDEADAATPEVDDVVEEAEAIPDEELPVAAPADGAGARREPATAKPMPAIAVAIPVEDDEAAHETHAGAARMDPGRVAGSWNVDVPLGMTESCELNADTAAIAPAQPAADGGRPPVVAVPAEAAEPPREAVYHDGANEDRLRITQQIVDHPAELAKRGQESMRTGYSRLLNSIYDAVLITDANGEILELNARAEEKFHTDEESLRGLCVVDLISGADRQLLDVLHANMEHQKFTLLEAVCQAAGDVRFDAEIVVNRLEGDSDGRLCFFVRDLSKRKTPPPPVAETPPAAARAPVAPLDEKLREMIDRLLHQLNDPVQVLICMAELENHEDYKSPLNQIESTLKQLMACVSETNADGKYPDEAESEPEPQPEPCRRDAVLIVEDDDMVGRMLQKTLAAAMPQAALDRVANESGARNRFGKHHHAVVVLDARIPGFPGEEAFAMFEQLCKERNWRMPAVVFCTEHSAVADIRAFLTSKPEHTCLAKPFKPDELVQSVRQGAAQHG